MQLNLFLIYILVRVCVYFTGAWAVGTEELEFYIKKRIENRQRKYDWR